MGEGKEMIAGRWYTDKELGQRLKVVVVNELTCEIVDEWGIRRLVNRAMMETMTLEKE